jgi:hypothetical protein
MSKDAGRITKQDIIKKIGAILKKNIDLDAKSVFDKIEEFLEPSNKAEGFASGEIGYVHIDERLQDEYSAWEKSIKQEWFEIIENIRGGIKEKKK